MSIESGLQAHLKADAGVAALVGVRVYPLVLPQNAVLPGPSLTYRVVSESPHHSHDGASGPTETRVQIDLHVELHAEAVALRDAVRKALQGLKGDMGGQAVQGVFYVNRRDLYDDEPQTFRPSMDFMIWHAETE